MDDRSMRNEFKHECELPHKEDVLSIFIQDGWYVNFRRKLRKQLLLSETDYRSKVYFKSAFVIRREKLKHLKFHYYMIHPLSNFAFVWELIMVVVFFGILFAIPLNILTDYSLEYIKLFLDVLCIVNVIIEMNTGYINVKYSKVFLDRKSVTLYRLRHWFFLDVLSSANFDLPSHLFSPDYHHYFEMLRFLALLKFFRIVTLFQYIDTLFERRHGSIFKYKMFKLLIMVLMVICWNSSIIFVVLKDYDFGAENHVATEYFLLFCFHTSLQILLNFGMVYQVKKVSFILFQIFGLFVGFLIQMIIISQVVQIINKSNYSRKKYYQLTQQLYEFMRYKSLPSNIRKRIFAYINYRFQQNYYKESEILGIFSEQLRQEMLLHIHIHLLESVDIFSELPVPILYKIINNMKSEIYLPSDVIVTAGTLGESMLFVVSGTAAIYTATGKEVCHLSEGANFGELALILDGEHRMASVVAIDVCEILILQRKDFLRQIERYPEIYDRIKRITQYKVKKTLLHENGGSENSMSVKSIYS